MLVLKAFSCGMRRRVIWWISNVSEETATFCNCNLFAFYKSKLGYNPVDIDTVTYILI